eukprot:3855395-Amphidinium_carterae.1
MSNGRYAPFSAFTPHKTRGIYAHSSSTEAHLFRDRIQNPPQDDAQIPWFECVYFITMVGTKKRVVPLLNGFAPVATQNCLHMLLSPKAHALCVQLDATN